MNANDRAVAAYRRTYGTDPTIVVRAPGRVNLIGEHTDYNDGFVLPLAIDRDTVIAAGPGLDGGVNSVASDYADATDRFDPHAAIDHASDGWADYVRGVAKMLVKDGFSIGGAQLAIAGDIPLGSGLSSSAALEVAVGRALVELGGATIDPTLLAKVGQRAENEFVGCSCGIMDQLVSARGIADHALLIDCRSLSCASIPMPSGTAVIIAHSGVRHAHAGGEYNDRRAQCEIASQHYGVNALRDLDLAALEAGKAGLDPAAYRRARHVVTENARTVAAAGALTGGDLYTLGKLILESHASMRDDFEITVPAVDRLAEIMMAPLDGEGGARMTGGGFGGCVIAVAPASKVDAVVQAVAQHYRTPEDAAAEVFVCVPSDGATRVA